MDISYVWKEIQLWNIADVAWKEIQLFGFLV